MSEKLNSLASYTIGGCAISASLANISTVAQELAMILGFIVVVVRLVHDSVGLYKRLTREGE